MFDKDVFLRKNFGDDITTTINDTMTLLDSEDYSILNPLEVKNNLSKGVINTNKKIDIHYEQNRDRIIFNISDQEYKINFIFEGNKLSYYLFKQTLINGGIISYEMTKNGLEEYDYYTKETCDRDKIDVDSVLIRLKGDSFKPDEEEFYKNSKCNMKNLRKGLTKLFNTKNRIEAEYARESKR